MYKCYSITGWWNQPNFHVPVLITTVGVGIVSIDNNQSFSGILVVGEDKTINDKLSILYDKNGGATLHFGSLNLDTGIIAFTKYYLNRSDGIEYSALYNPEIDCWEGSFGGARTGEGTARFYLKELPDALFVENAS
jgi:hypothetical protein